MVRVFRKDSDIGKSLLKRRGTTTVIPTKVPAKIAEQGSFVQVTRGKHEGCEGKVFWFDDAEVGERRVGVRLADGEGIFVKESHIEVPN